jgi:phosphoribosylformylglycinamidine cyclo-ligase
MYQAGEYDLAGTIVGVVDRKRMIDGSRIKPGDVLIGLASDGLHTNGYSLAREVLLKTLRCDLDARLPGLSKPLGEELLRVHRNYQPLLAQLPAGLVKGLAHITGGGLLDNLPRTLPGNADAVIDTKSWKVPALFQHIQRGGKIRSEEMYQVFNMGIGMAVIVAADDAKDVARTLKARTIGQIESGTGITRLSF